MSGDIATIKTLLKKADSAWRVIVDSEIYLYDRQDTDEWIRTWLNAISLGMADD